MQNDQKKQECASGSCDKKGDAQCAGGVCQKSGEQKKEETDFKQTEPTKDLRQDQSIPQSNTLGQDMKGVQNVGKETNKSDQHLPVNNTGKDLEVSAAGKFDR